MGMGFWVGHRLVACFKVRRSQLLEMLKVLSFALQFQAYISSFTIVLSLELF